MGCIALYRRVGCRSAFPAALGVESSGSVLAVGADITALRVGDQVLAHEAPLPTGSGFWAERTLIDEYPPAAGYELRPKGQRVLSCVHGLY